MAYTIQQVKDEIKKLTSMSALDPKEYGEEGGLADSLVSGSEGSKFRNSLKINQLRKVFDGLKAVHRRIRKEDENKEFDRKDVMKLLTMLAYSCGRQLIPKDFYDIMKEGLSKEKLKTNKDFLRLHDYVEAILAFHKYRSDVKEKGGEK